MKQKTNMVTGQTIPKGFTKARRLGVGVVGASLAFAMLASASAGVINDGFALLVDWDDKSWTSANLNEGVMTQTLFDGGASVNFSVARTKDWSIQSLNSSYTYNPSQSNAFTFTNMTGVTNTFTVTVTTPGILVGPSSMWGSITGGLTDNFPHNGATVGAAFNSSVYTAMIDGAPVQTLWDHPFSISTLHPNVSSLGFANFEDVDGPGVVASISIVHEFTLTAGDSVTINSAFHVIENVIPGPGGLALLLGAMCFKRRRRS